MSTTPIDIYNGQPGIAVEELFECPENTRVFVTAACGCNNNTVAKYVTLYRVPAGAAAAAANIIYNKEVLSGKQSKSLSNLIGHMLAPGYKLYGLQETADQITLHISGVAKT